MHSEHSNVQVLPTLLATAGEDSSNEDQAEEGDDKETKSKHKAEAEAEADDGGELPVIPEEGKVDAEEDEGSAEEEEEEEEKLKSEEEDKEFAFPDTTISLSHLQPSR